MSGYYLFRSRDTYDCEPDDVKAIDQPNCVYPIGARLISGPRSIAEAIEWDRFDAEQIRLIEENDRANR